jgi:hypothetical protein
MSREIAVLCACLHAPSDLTPLIQQIQITAGHIICSPQPKAGAP